MTKRNRIIEVFALPELVPTNHQCDICIAIDVLRATTTITTAIQNGAKDVVPFLTVKETFQAKENWLRQNVETPLNESSNNLNRLILGGERQGLPIEGFDAGNSPDSYSPEFVGKQTLFFSTTNGTKAILRALSAIQRDSADSKSSEKTKSLKYLEQTESPELLKPAEGLAEKSTNPLEPFDSNKKTQQGEVFIASFLNAQAVVDLTERYFQQRFCHFNGANSSQTLQNEKISIICAGTEKQYTEEDLLLAGCFVERFSSFELLKNDSFLFSLNVQAETVRETWRNIEKDARISLQRTASVSQFSGTEASKEINSNSIASQGFSKALIPIIEKQLFKSRGGRNLRKIHLEKDIHFAAQLDSVSVVPHWKNGVLCRFAY